MIDRGSNRLVASTQFRRPPDGSGALALVAIFILVFALKAIILLQASSWYGRLAVPPVYDDVAYFVDALERKGILLERGLFGLVQDLVAHPPHAHYSTLAALVAFLFGGANLAGPYFMNAIALALLSAMLCRLFRAGGSVGTTVALVLIATPWFDNVVIIYHPDLVSGFATAVIAALLIWQTEIITTRSRAFVLGLAAALILFIKPVAFAMVLGLWGIAFILGAILARLEEKTWRLAGMRLLFGAAMPCVFLTPYLIGELGFIIAYIHTGMVVQRETWSHRLAASEHTLFYANAAVVTFGYWSLLIVGTIAVVVGSSIASLERSTALRFVALLLVAFAGYLVPQLLEVKHYLYGGMLYGCLAVCIVLGCHFVVDRMWHGRRAVRLAFCVGVGCLAVTMTSDTQGRYSSALQRSMTAEYDEVYRMMVGLIGLRQQARVPDAERLLAFIPMPQPVPPPAYRFRGLVDRFDIVILPSGSGDERGFIDAAMRAAIVVIPDDEAMGMVWPYPEKLIIPAFRAWLNQDTRLKLFGTVRTLHGAAEVFAEVPIR